MHLSLLLLVASSLLLSAAQQNVAFSLDEQNPDLDGAIGDTFSFNIVDFPEDDTFAIRTGSLDEPGSDRYLTSPEFLEGPGLLLLTLGMDLAEGDVLWYLDEDNTEYAGRICVRGRFCAALDECGGSCIRCIDGYELLDGSTTCTLIDNGCTTLPANCLAADCRDNQYFCTSCQDGFLLSAAGTCLVDGCTTLPANCLAADCRDNQYFCTSCQDGFALSAEGMCLANNGCLTLPANCLAADCRDNQYICTSCRDGWTLAADGTCLDSGGLQCLTPENCNKADCWDGPAGTKTVQCTECMTGFFIQADGTCKACTPCKQGEYISYQCQGWTDNICTACRMCPSGQTLMTPCSGTGLSDTAVCSGGDGGTGGNGVHGQDCDIAAIPFCEKADCWPSDHDVEIQCTQCSRGYWIDSSLRCSQCRSCAVGEWISYPCEGYTNTVCSTCTPCDWDKRMVAPCPGNGTADAATCETLNCVRYGCGASNIGVTCNEIDDRSFSCQCAGSSPVVINVPSAFEGCGFNTSQPPSDEDVVANINGTMLSAKLRDGILEITGAIMVDVEGRSFTLQINSTVPVGDLEDSIKQQIAAFLGGSYTADDVNLQYSSKRSNTAQVGVTIDGNASSGSALRRNFHLFMFGLLYLTMHY